MKNFINLPCDNKCVNHVTFFQNFVTHLIAHHRIFVSENYENSLLAVPYSKDPVRAELTGIRRTIDHPRMSDP
jgi:hypothetical protein